MLQFWSNHPLAIQVKRAKRSRMHMAVKSTNSWARHLLAQMTCILALNYQLTVEFHHSLRNRYHPSLAQYFLTSSANGKLGKISIINHLPMQYLHYFKAMVRKCLNSEQWWRFLRWQPPKLVFLNLGKVCRKSSARYMRPPRQRLASVPSPAHPCSTFWNRQQWAGIWQSNPNNWKPSRLQTGRCYLKMDFEMDWQFSSLICGGLSKGMIGSGCMLPHAENHSFTSFSSGQWIWNRRPKVLASNLFLDCSGRWVLSGW